MHFYWVVIGTDVKHPPLALSLALAVSLVLSLTFAPSLAMSVSLAWSLTVALSLPLSAWAAGVAQRVSDRCRSALERPLSLRT